MSPHHPTPTASALVILALLPAACGGSSYTKGDFLARANAICASTVRRTRQVPPPSSSTGAPGGLGGLAAYLDQVLPLVASESHQLSALPRPPASAHQRAALNRYLAAVAVSVRSYGALDSAAHRGDVQAVASSEAALRANPVSSLAAGYGLSSCGAPGSSAV